MACLGAEDISDRRYGLLEYELTTESVNGEMFLQFVQGSLIPQMASFDGLSERSIEFIMCPRSQKNLEEPES